MNSRERLREALGVVARKLEGESTASVPVAGGEHIRVNIPLFGNCTLVPHAVEHFPQGSVAIAYVKLQGDGDNLTPAIWHDGTWHSRQMKPLKRRVVAWYHIEGRADG